MRTAVACFVGVVVGLLSATVGDLSPLALVIVTAGAAAAVDGPLARLR